MGMKNFKYYALILALFFTLVSTTGCLDETQGMLDALTQMDAPNTMQATETVQPDETLSAQKIDGKLEAHYLDVGQGDSIYISLPNEQTILIDAGDNGYGNQIVDYIKSLGVSRIDYLIATHPHADHIGGMDTVINNLEIGDIFMPDITSTTKTFERLITAIENKDLSITIAEAGMTLFDLDNLKAVFVAPISATSDANNMSAVLHISYRNTTFLFTGDVEKESEKEMLNSPYHIKADILKVAHHGSNTSSTTEFVKEVAPKFAIISCGKGNQYGHPHSKTLATLTEAGVQIYRTDEVGTIIATSDGKSITLDKNATKIMPNAPPQETEAPVITPKPQTPSAQNIEVFVFITKTGERYHLGHCSSLSKIKIPISLEDAKKSGYTACKRCQPPQ